MQWTLANIRTLCRTLTGRIDSNVVADSVIDQNINSFYQYQFPDEVDVREFDAFISFVTVAGTETYDLPVTTAEVEPPITIEDSDGVVTELDFYGSVGTFKEDYPDDAHNDSDERDQPQGLLLFGRDLILRPVPDDVYTISYTGKSTQPTALSGDSATLDDNKWGPLIAYGAAIEYLAANGQKAEADELGDMYNYYKISIDRKQLRLMPVTERAVPRF